MQDVIDLTPEHVEGFTAKTGNERLGDSSFACRYRA